MWGWLVTLQRMFTSPEFFQHSSHDVSPTTAAYTAEITHHHADAVAALRSIIHHPRSLARPTSTWRPPTKSLPPIGSGPRLKAALTRRRVGPRARARLRSYGPTQVPACLVDLHLTDASGQPPDCRVTEAWVRALVPDGAIEAVHEVPSLRAVSYVWLVDSDFNPVAAPAAMFANLPAA